MPLAVILSETTLKFTVMKNIIGYFLQGGLGGMCVITLILVAIFFAAWKAPAWVRNLGRLGFMAGFIWTMMGIFQMLDYLGQNPETGAGIIYGGLKVAMIPLLYSSFVYVVALIINTVQKPRLY